MSDVHRYQAVQMFTEEGNKITYSPTGPWVVMASTYNTAQSELAALREELAESGKADHLRQRIAFLTTEIHKQADRLVAAEQLNAELELKNAYLTEAICGCDKCGGWVEERTKPTEPGASE